MTARDAFSVLLTGGAKQNQQAGGKRKQETPPPSAAGAPPTEGPPASLIDWSADAVPSAVLRKRARESARSGSLHDFFGGQDHTAPSVLYLDSDFSASFCRNLPRDAHRLSQTVRWAGKDLVVACSRDRVAGGGEWQPRASRYSNQAGHLKSHLQVCADAALRSFTLQRSGAACSACGHRRLLNGLENKSSSHHLGRFDPTPPDLFDSQSLDPTDADYFPNLMLAIFNLNPQPPY